MPDGGVLLPTFHHLDPDLGPPEWSIFHSSRGRGAASSRRVNIVTEDTARRSPRSPAQGARRSPRSPAPGHQQEIAEILGELRLLGSLPLNRSTKMVNDAIHLPNPSHVQ